METYRRREPIIAEQPNKIDKPLLMIVKNYEFQDRRQPISKNKLNYALAKHVGNFKVTTRVYRVGELATEMRDLLEMSYSSVWIEGELSALSQPASGHIYFTIKDDQAQIRCAMFRAQTLRMSIKPKIGDQVKIRGKISLYTARGDLQCIVQSMESAGEGQLFRAFEILKQRLSLEGLFDAARKRTLPRFPNNIGIISSPNAAALHDILTTLKRRCPGIPVTLYPSLVQGEEASIQLINAIKTANQAERSDVLILARGGGSIEDLWCFNNEQLAYAIAESKIPIISAVGHEIDFTIADFVADLRAPTPTAAAEMVAPDSDALVGSLVTLRHRSVRQLQRRLEYSAQRVDALQFRLIHPAQQIEHKRQRWSESAARFKHAYLQQERERSQNLLVLSKRAERIKMREMLALKFRDLQRVGRQVTTLAQQQHKRRTDQLNNLGESLNLVSPLATLQRGYAIARDKQNAILREAHDQLKGQSINVQLGRGELNCEVIQVTQDD